MIISISIEMTQERLPSRMGGAKKLIHRDQFTGPMLHSALSE